VQLGLLFRHVQFATLLRDVISFTALAAALYIFFISFYTKTVRYRNLQPLVLATLFAISFAIATLVLGLLDSVLFHSLRSNLFFAVETNAKYEFLVGLGIGLGVLLLDNGYVRKTGELIKRLLGSLGASFKEFGERL
jgi:hypothetical protein